ncbi:MAG: (2Fe-2S)-binding protein [bacterium]|nr:(2Fe-2S)-binding protein [bacterium]
MAVVNLTVNGQAHTLDVDPDTPLLWILRDHLDLTGTKYGCGVGECGSCTVLLDGEAVRSCSLSVREAAAGAVTTIEGLGRDGLHPVQKAWKELEVPQCGYCQPGQILTAVALLDRNPRPADAEITAAMSGVLCRCGTYQRIGRAVKKASEGGGR